MQWAQGGLSPGHGLVELQVAPQVWWRVAKQDGEAKSGFVGVGIQVLNVGVDAEAPSLPSLGCKGWGFRRDMGQGERVGGDDEIVDLSGYVHWLWLSHGPISDCCEQSNLIHFRFQNASRPHPRQEICHHVCCSRLYSQLHSCCLFSCPHHCVWSHCCDYLRMRCETER